MPKMFLSLTLAAAVALAGCQLTRQNYQTVKLGQTQDEVRKALGSPQTESAEEWVYAADSNTPVRATVRFGPDQKVIEKSWQNPERPWENDRERQTP
jgi:outer membrane protein assembly factor BamE (lipoprotein component of BamABCDE complex)